MLLSSCSLVSLFLFDFLGNLAFLVFSFLHLSPFCLCSLSCFFKLRQKKSDTDIQSISFADAIHPKRLKMRWQMQAATKNVEARNDNRQALRLPKQTPELGLSRATGNSTAPIIEYAETRTTRQGGGGYIRLHPTHPLPNRACTTREGDGQSGWVLGWVDGWVDSCVGRGGSVALFYITCIFVQSAGVAAHHC